MLYLKGHYYGVRVSYFGILNFRISCDFFQNNVRDKLTPIVVDFTFELVEKTRNKRDVTPVLNQRTPTTASAEVNTSIAELLVGWLFLAVPWDCLRFVIVVFPDHTHLLFFILIRVCTVCIIKSDQRIRNKI